MHGYTKEKEIRIKKKEAWAGIEAEIWSLALHIYKKLSTLLYTY